MATEKSQREGRQQPHYVEWLQESRWRISQSIQSVVSTSSLKCVFWASTFFWGVTLICKCSRMASVKQIQQWICDEFEWRCCCNRLATLGFRVACFSSCLLPEAGLAVKQPIKVLLFPFRRNTLKLL
ncbi:unnamed protein product [Sphagnum balticum]